MAAPPPLIRPCRACGKELGPYRGGLISCCNDACLDDWRKATNTPAPPTAPLDAAGVLAAAIVTAPIARRDEASIDAYLNSWRAALGADDTPTDRFLPCLPGAVGNLQRAGLVPLKCAACRFYHREDEPCTRVFS